MSAQGNGRQMTRAGHSIGEVFRAFLGLGLTSFGGPIAHLGYMRDEFVARRRWLDDARFAQLLAVCQFLPGPASSQLGFAIGLLRAGWAGAIAAFIAFTLPSALLLFALATVSDRMQQGIGADVVHGLKLVAVAVVAHGVTQMAKQMLTDSSRILIAALACAVILFTGSALAQIGVIAAGALLGDMFCDVKQPETEEPLRLWYGARAVMISGALFAALLAGALLHRGGEASVAGLAASFYRAGALVFGGGHVVLPLLETSLVGPGWIEESKFLAGYGAAQAIPGPMFSLAAFLGAEVSAGVPSVVSGTVALLAVFLPGFLLLVAILPFWSRLHASTGAQRSIAGVSAAVVGLLGAALYDPVWTSAIDGSADVAISVVAFAVLLAFDRSVVAVVAWCVGATVFRSVLT